MFLQKLSNHLFTILNNFRSLSLSHCIQKSILCFSIGCCALNGHTRSIWFPVHSERLRYYLCPQHHDQLCPGFHHASLLFSHKWVQRLELYHNSYICFCRFITCRRIFRKMIYSNFRLVTSRLAKNTAVSIWWFILRLSCNFDPENVSQINDWVKCNLILKTNIIQLLYLTFPNVHWCSKVWFSNIIKI